VFLRADLMTLLKEEEAIPRPKAKPCIFLHIRTLLSFVGQEWKMFTLAVEKDFQFVILG
jgi:hypothetical protein